MHTATVYIYVCVFYLIFLKSYLLLIISILQKTNRQHVGLEKIDPQLESAGVLWTHLYLKHHDACSVLSAY